MADTPSTEEVVKLQDVCRHYTVGGETVKALDGVSFSIRRGEYWAIMGPSGSGKSTLLNILGCLDVPTRGSYLLDGIEVAARTRKELAHIRNRKLGFVFQNFNLLPRTSALENVMMPAYYCHPRRPGNEIRRRALELIRMVGLEERMHHTPAQLSGGQQQRVAIARSLINNPGILLADEPTGNLDSTTSVEVMPMFRVLNRRSGITVIIVTHDRKTAAFTDRAINMVDGLIAEGVSDELSANLVK